MIRDRVQIYDRFHCRLRHIVYILFAFPGINMEVNMSVGCADRGLCSVYSATETSSAHLRGCDSYKSLFDPVNTT
jgi:hypothetical protein